MNSRRFLALARVCRRIGLPGGAAVALFAFAAWGHWFVTADIECETAELQRQLAPGASRQRAAAADNTVQDIDAVYALLPSRDTANDALAQLLESARAAGLSVSTVQYRTTADRLPGVWRYEIDMPLKGPYEAVRGWLAETLRAHASLSLDVLDLSHKQPESGDIDAHLVLSLFVKETGSPPPAGVSSR